MTEKNFYIKSIFRITVFILVLLIFPFLLTNYNRASAETARLLGMVTGIKIGCQNDFYYYGDNCGNDACKGTSNYTVTWYQGANSGSLNNNDCEEPINAPRYTFETEPNQPQGDADGEDIIVRLNMSDLNYTFGSWVRTTTTSTGDICAPSDTGTNLTVNTKIYKNGDCQWNHLWFFEVRTGQQCIWTEAARTPGGSYGIQNPLPAGAFSAETLGKWKRVDFDGYPGDTEALSHYIPSSGADAYWWTETYNDDAWANQAFVHWESPTWEDYDYFPIPEIGKFAWISAPQNSPNAEDKTDLHRRIFNIPNNATVENARIYMFSDNGSLFYINGNIVSGAGGSYTLKDDINKAFFQTGSNVLAVQVSNTNNPMGLQYKLDVCLKNIVDSPSPTPPVDWMITQIGDAFVKLGVEFGDQFMQTTLNQITHIANANLPELNGQKPYFSSYSYLQQTNEIITCDNCSGLQDQNKNYFAGLYEDNNTSPADGWYAFLVNKLAKSDLIDLTVGSLGPISSADQLPDVIEFKNGVGVLQITDNLTINSGFICTTQTIFLIQKDLILKPDIINLNNQKGCLFVVGGETVVSSGTRKASADSVNYDIVQAFIITDKFTSTNDTSGNMSDGLKISGSVITSVANFGRSVVAVNLKTPAELISYDARYITIFKNILDDPNDFSIREKPYINLVE